MTPRRRVGPWQPAAPDLDMSALAIDQPSRGTGGRRSEGRQPRVVRGTVENLSAALAAGDPDGGGLAGATIDSTVLAGTRVLGGEVAGLRLRDVLVDQGVLAGVVIDGGGGTRIQIRGGRVSGTVWIRGEFHDLVLEQVRADGVTLRSCRLHRARFTGCDLSGLDLTGTRLDHVRFEDCNLDGAVFTEVTITAAAFHRCRFDGAVGVDGLAGAEVDADSVMTLVGPMAAALAISVV
ncbi:pentapeptide repeat-containing protein [Frankia sp. Cpl3]|nr:pentapeptide repeat-containing protein [Frankia sp. Cpl3]